MRTLSKLKGSTIRSFGTPLRKSENVAVPHDLPVSDAALFSAAKACAAQTASGSCTWKSYGARTQTPDFASFGPLMRSVVLAGKCIGIGKAKEHLLLRFGSDKWPGRERKRNLMGKRSLFRATQRSSLTQNASKEQRQALDRQQHWMSFVEFFSSLPCDSLFQRAAAKVHRRPPLSLPDLRKDARQRCLIPGRRSREIL